MLNIDEIQNGIVIDHIKAGTAIGLMDNPAKVYPFIWDAYLRPCYEALERGEAEACQSLYTKMVQELARRYLRIQI